MAVKVMVAPAIVNGDIEKKEAPRLRETPPAKPKRRRSSIYDADGNEVFITLMCLKCHKMRPLSQFGLRKMADGAIRNQPWCRPCRSAAGTDKPRAKGSAQTEESAPSDASPVSSQLADGSAAAQPQSKRPGSSVAAEVAAALAAGRR